jgi:hypothetical protein
MNYCTEYRYISGNLVLNKSSLNDVSSHPKFPKSKLLSGVRLSGVTGEGA